MPTTPSEQALLHVYAEHVGLALAERTFTLPGGLRVGVDGADSAVLGAELTTLVQVTAAAGTIKSAQRNTVLADAFKLAWLRSTHAPQARAVLVLADPFARILAPGAWLPIALADLGIEAVIVADGGIRTP